MVKKMTRKISKKRYSKRAKRISRRSYRRTYRRKDKRKIKKTRKKNIKYKNNYQTGGAGLSRFTKAATAAADAIQEKWTKIPREETIHMDAINILYNGNDPAVVDEMINKYRSECTEVLRSAPSDPDDPESRKKQIQIIKNNYSSIIPKYIIISGHGNQLPCGRVDGDGTQNMKADPCFTLIPEGYKLILATKAGAKLLMAKSEGLDDYRRAIAGERFGMEVSDSELYLLNSGGQLRHDYFRVYSGGGIINNEIIDFRLDHEVCAEYEKDKSGNIVKTEDGGNKCSRNATQYMEDSGVIVKFVESIITEQDIMAKNKGEWVTDKSRTFVEHVAGGPYNLKKNYSTNFQTYRITRRDKDLSPRVVIGEGYKPHRNPLERLDALDQVEIPTSEEYAEIFTTSLEDRIDKGLYLKSLLDYELMKSQIKKSAEKMFLGGPGLSLPELDGPPGDFFDLAQLFHMIKEEGERDLELPKVILGGFCRDTMKNVANQTDMFLSSQATDVGLPQLTKRYFNGDINFAGDSSELTKQKSLASKTKTQDFLTIFEKVKSHAKPENFDETVLENFENVKRRIDNPTHPDGGIKLSFYDACLVFQMDLYLIQKGI